MLNASVARLTTPEWERIVRLGAERHAQELKKELKAVRQQIGAFERKYGQSFAQLQRVGLPDDAGLEAHEDYVEWNSWQGREAELMEKLQGVDAITGHGYGG